MWLTCQVERVSATLASTVAACSRTHVPMMAVRGRPVVWPVMSAISLEVTLAADDFDRLGTPGVALLGQRARFVFGLPCLQGGLLGDRQHFHDRGFAAVFGLKCLGQLADTMLDRRAARGPQLGEFGGDAEDFTHRPLTGCGV